MLKVEIQIESLNFWWAEKGWSWGDDSPIECFWEDIYYSVKRNGKEIRSGCMTFESRGFSEEEIKNLNGYIGSKMEVNFPGYIEENLNAVRYNNILYKDLPKCNDLMWEFSYSERGDDDFYEIIDMDVPADEFGVRPRYITGFIPERSLSRDNVQKYFKSYLSDFMGFSEEVEYEWLDIPEDKYLRDELDGSCRQHEEWAKKREDGETFKMVFLPQPLEMFLGKERVKELTDRGMIKAEMDPDTEKLVFHFEDGHTEIDGTEIDMSDHFSEPEKDWE
jgi:hypothetical protein